MRSVRPVVFWIHLAIGVMAGLVILTMSATGVLLTYEKQMIAWADARAYRLSPPARGSRLTIDELLARVRSEGHEPVSILLRSAPNRAAEVTTRDGIRMIDPYTGVDLGAPPSAMRTFFRAVTNWHRWLGAAAPGSGRATGRAVTGAANLGFLFLVVSGFYLWLPRTWTWPRFRNALWFRQSLTSRPREFNWHNVIGFWCAMPLAIVVASATVISYPWASNLVYRVVGENPPPAGRAPSVPLQPSKGTAVDAEVGSTLPLEELWRRAATQMPSALSISMRYPEGPQGPVGFTLDAGNGGQPQLRATLALDPRTGQVVRWEPFSTLSRGRRIRSVLRFAHTGEVAGLVGQTVAGLVSAGGTVLVWTGLAMAWRRFFKRRNNGVLMRDEGRAA